jgi:hypothetical protein
MADKKTVQQAIAESQWATPADQQSTPTITFLSKEQIRALKARHPKP